jgi:hypothetical protein
VAYFVFANDFGGCRDIVTGMKKNEPQPPTRKAVEPQPTISQELVTPIPPETRDGLERFRKRVADAKRRQDPKK